MQSNDNHFFRFLMVIQKHNALDFNNVGIRNYEPKAASSVTTTFSREAVIIKLINNNAASLIANPQKFRLFHTIALQRRGTKV